MAPMLAVAPRDSILGEVVARSISDSGRWDTCAWLRDVPSHVETGRRAMVDALALRGGTVGRGGDPITLTAALSNAPPGSIVVVEVVDGRAGPIAGLLRSSCDIARQHDVEILVLCQRRVAARLRRAATTLAPVDTSDVVIAAGRNAGFDDRLISCLRRGSGGSDAVVYDLAAACHYRSIDLSEATGWWPHRRHVFLRRLTRLVLDVMTEEQHEALSMALATGYWHSQFSGGSVTVSALRPWLVPLEHGWGWVRPIWRRSLAAELGRPRRSGVSGCDVSVDPVPLRAEWRPVLDARLLGDFELRLDNRRIEGLHGHLAGSVLRYLLTRANHGAHRDELLEAFWPGVDPERSRNRLQVVISSLRRAVRTMADIDVVQFDDGFYRVNPDIDLRIDVEDFETLAKRAHDAATSDAPSFRDIAQRALRLYRGHLCADLPYEEWTILLRERLRMVYGDLLDTLVAHQWRAGDLTGCIETARRLLEEDPCREDMHRLLIRSYDAIGRPDQALRQFEACRRILLATLDASPTARTIVARDEARAHQIV